MDAANDFAERIRHRMKRTKNVSMSGEEGSVKIVKHPYSIQGEKVYMYRPVVEEIIRRGLAKDGTACILTQTNEEAAILVAMLNKHGIRGKMVQSADGLCFWNLAETRYFLKHVSLGVKADNSPVISDGVWEEAKQKTFSKYAESESLPYLKRSLAIFEQTNRAKYYSDFREFVIESSVEDFCDISDAEVAVSTIHKAKGREFDNVVMLVTAPQHPTDDIMRRYYVGMTRAKRTLTIHTNGDIFDGIRADTKILDGNAYAMPEEIVLQLSHKDVNLGFSKRYKREILTLMSGDDLSYHDFCLAIPGTGTDIARLSMKMQEKVTRWEAKGYRVTSAKVRFIVAWKPKDAPREEEETAIVLADLAMRKMNSPDTQESHAQETQ